MVIHTKRFILTDFKISGRRWPSVAVGVRRWPSVGFIVWCELGFTFIPLETYPYITFDRAMVRH